MNPKFFIIMLVAMTWRSLSLGGDIFEAAKAGDLEQVRSLLNSNPDLAFSNNSAAGFTPLHWAVRFSSKEVAKLLLANKANVDVTDGFGRRPMQFAITVGDREMVELLLQSNACIECKDNTFGYSPLRWALEAHNLEMMQLFLTYKADVNTKDNNGRTPLALARGTNEAKLLLMYKADVNARANDGRTPLHIAAYSGQRDVAELLLANNAEVNATDNAGNTPLQLGFDKKDITALLLRQHGGHGKQATAKHLVGWYYAGDFGSENDKVIIDDYKRYIEKLTAEQKTAGLQIAFFEDGSGQHAVYIGRVWKAGWVGDYTYDHILFYNKKNKRIKVIKYVTGRYMS